ncbi:MAG: DnaB-like helicase C-terminal domain-containing protein [Sphingomonadales bacterium]
MVSFIYRPEYYGLTQDSDGNSTLGIGEIIIAKHRNGALNNVSLRLVRWRRIHANLKALGVCHYLLFQQNGLTEIMQ